ncbi:Beta-barrel assembly-enhancing protease [bioreactor metagenome]|uniref:Beta-barrel assembly-enhancing protease n=1 Tax=bioreactor metagenome TaxID=1076179 RepID=A0A644XUX8_9ZZZZ
MYSRQLAALAQIAGKSDNAEALLKNAERILAAELAGIKVQQFSLLDENGQVPANDEVKSAKALVDDPQLRAELNSALDGKANQAKSLLDELEEGEDAEATGLLSKGIRALNWTPRNEIKTAIANEQWVDALQRVNYALVESPADVELLGYRSQISKEMGDAGMYQSTLEEISQFERSNETVKRELAHSYETEGNWASAFTHYEDLINQFGSEEKTDLMGYAQAAAETNQPVVALEAAQKVLDQDPENGRALAVKGFAEYRLGQADLALEHLSKAVDSAPELAEPWKMLAQVYREKGEIARAIDTLRTAHAAVPADASILRELAAELISEGQASEAYSILSGDEADVAMDLQTSLLKIAAMKKLNMVDVESTIEKTYKAFSTQTDAIHEYADLMLRKGDQEKARKLIEPLALAAQAKTGWKLTYVDSVLGQDYRHILGQPMVEETLQQKASQVLADVLASEPENIYANVLEAEKALKSGETEKAFDLFSNLLNHIEAQGSNWLERIQAGFAWAANLLGKFNYALAGIQSVLEANPNWAGARETLAEVSAASGEIEEAVVQANQVLDSAADVAESVEWFADFMGNLGKTEEAEKSILTLSQSHAQKLPLLLKLTELKLANGKKEEAKQTIESCKNLLAKSKNESELVRGAKLFAEVGKEDLVVECLKMRSVLPDAAQQPALLDLAGFFRMNKQYEQALNVIEQAAQHGENQSWVNLVHAEVLHAAGQSEAALRKLAELAESNQAGPEFGDLNFVPAIWKSLLKKGANVDVLAAELAFETGDYALAAEKAASGESSAEQTVLQVEIGYALGNAKETLSFVDMSADDPAIYVDAHLSSEIAESLLDAGQIEKAGLILNKAVEIFPQADGLALVEARYLAELGQLVQAESLFDQVLAKVSIKGEINSVEETLTVRALVKAAAAANRWEEAKSWSDKLYTSQPKSLAAVKIALEVLLLAIEFGKMIAGLRVKKHLNVATLRSDSNVATIKDLISKAEQLGTPELDHLVIRAKLALEANQANIRAMAMNTPQKGDVVAMMLALKESGQAATAVQLAKKQIPAADVLYATACCLQETNPSEALLALKQSLKKNSAQPWASTLAAMLYEKGGQAYAAMTDLNEALEYWPDEPDWQVLAAEFAHENGNQKEAVLHLEYAAELEPENDQIKYWLGKSYLQNSEGEKAIETLAPISKTGANNYEVWETLAEAYFAQNDTENALAAAERASSVNGFSISPMVLSSKLYLANGEKKKALEFAQKAVAQDATNAEVQLLLAKSWMANGDKLQALQALEKAVHAKNASLEVMVDHAKLIKEINGAANARPLFEALVQKYPENVDILNLLAEAQLACADKAAAELSAQKSLKLNDLQPKMQQFLGKLEFEGGHLDQAIFHYSQAIAQEPQDVEVYLDLSNAYQQQREYDEAVKTLQAAIDLAPRDTRPLLAAVNLLRNAKDYTNAEALLRRAAEIAPNDLNIRRQLGAVIALNMVHSSQEASSHV